MSCRHLGESLIRLYCRSKVLLFSLFPAPSQQISCPPGAGWDSDTLPVPERAGVIKGLTTSFVFPITRSI